MHIIEIPTNKGANSYKLNISKLGNHYEILPSCCSLCIEGLSPYKVDFFLSDCSFITSRAEVNNHN